MDDNSTMRGIMKRNVNGTFFIVTAKCVVNKPVELILLHLSSANSFELLFFSLM